MSDNMEVIGRKDLTVNDLIKRLSNMSEELREKPIKIVAPNGLELEPEIKRKLINQYDPLNHSADNIEAIFLTW